MARGSVPKSSGGPRSRVPIGLSVGERFGLTPSGPTLLIDDAFTVSSDTGLWGHTPTETNKPGGTWEEGDDTSANNMTIDSATDTVGGGGYGQIAVNQQDYTARMMIDLDAATQYDANTIGARASGFTTNRVSATYFLNNGGTLRITEIVDSGEQNTLTQVTGIGQPAGMNELAIVVSGTTAKAYLNRGNEITATFDASLTFSNAHIRGYDGAVFDDFRVYDTTDITELPAL